MATLNSDLIKQIEMIKELNEINMDNISKKVDQNTDRFNDLDKKVDRITQTQLLTSATSGKVVINLYSIVRRIVSLAKHCYDSFKIKNIQSQKT